MSGVGRDHSSSKTRNRTNDLEAEKRIGTRNLFGNEAAIADVTTWRKPDRVFDGDFLELEASGSYSKVEQVTQTSTPQKVWEMDTSNTAFYRAYRIPSLYPGVSW